MQGAETMRCVVRSVKVSRKTGCRLNEGLALPYCLAKGCEVIRLDKQ